VIVLGEYESRLEVYGNRSELYVGETKAVYLEGRQTPDAMQRTQKIMGAFENGFYVNVMSRLQNTISTDALSDEQSKLIKSLVNGVTSEVGRALVGLTCLQLAIKSIEPEQSIRLHKGGRSDSRFSWQEGISMRTLDNTFNTPFLREYGLLKINKDGIMMTRSLAENYPYSTLYKAEMRGPVKPWVEIVEAIESGTLPPYPALCLLLSLLKNNSDAFSAKAEQIINMSKNMKVNFNDVVQMMTRLYNETTYSARAFEVVIHSFMQALTEMMLADGNLVPLSQMRSANKKHGNVGDVELRHGNIIIESWDAKYGKPYLRDELEELSDKLEHHPNVEVAGFVVNTDVDRSNEIMDRADEISIIHDCEIQLLSFSEWIDRKSTGLTENQLEELGQRWLIATVESFGQKRTEIASIDEPCDAWLESISDILSSWG
jgi:lambda repressor-like predicted transcriptional regulator